MRHAIAGALILVLLGGCEGKAGPVGPAGPSGTPGATGPQGPAGVGAASFFFSGQIPASGFASVPLTASMGTIDKLPQLSCYISNVAAGPYFAVAFDSNAQIYCGLGTNGSSSTLLAFLYSPEPTSTTPAPYAGWYYQFVIRPQS